MWYVENLLYIMEMVYECCFICNGHNILNLLSNVSEKVCGKCVEVFVLYVMETVNM